MASKSFMSRRNTLMCTTWLRSEPTDSSITLNDCRMRSVCERMSDPAICPVAGSKPAVPPMEMCSPTLAIWL